MSVKAGTLVVLLACAAGVVPVGSAGTQQPRRIQIEAQRFGFQPASVTLKRGEPVVLTLESDDVAHGLRIRELGVDLKATKGHASTAAFTPGKSGDFVGHCSVFCGAGHGKMTVTLHVE